MTNDSIDNNKKVPYDKSVNKNKVELEDSANLHCNSNSGNEESQPSSSDSEVDDSMENARTPQLPLSYPNVKKSNREGYYTQDEVAKIIGVTKQAVIKWRQQGIFVEDLRDHNGVYLYSKEKVMQLKEVYHKNWTLGGYAAQIDDTSGTVQDTEGGKPAIESEGLNGVELEKYRKTFMPEVTDAEINEITKQSELKKKIKQADPPKLLKPAGKYGYICPICGNGTGRDGTGIIPRKTVDGWDYKCWRCQNFGGDFLNLLAAVNRLDLNRKRDFKKALAIGKKLISDAYSGRLDDIHFDTSDATTSKIEHSDEESAIIMGDNYSADMNFDKIPAEFKRGINDDILRGHVGWLDDWIHPKNILDGKKVKPSRRLIVYNTRYDKHYNAVMPNVDRTSDNKPFWKMHAGEKDLFILNRGYPKFYSSVIIVEGEFDAMSIFQAVKENIFCIATLGAGERKKILKYLTEVFDDKKSRFNFTPIVMFDNDTGGIDNAKKLVTELRAAGFPAYSVLLADDEKIDANEYLIKRGEDALKTRIEQILSDASQRRATEQAKLILERENAEKKSNSDSETSEVDAAKSYFENLDDNDITDDFIFEDNCIKQAACLQINSPNDYEKLCARLKGKISVVNFKAAVAAEIKKITFADKEKRRADYQTKSKEFVGNFLENDKFKIPSGYTVDDTGIYYFEKRRPKRIATKPVFVSRTYYNVNEQTFLADVVTIRNGRKITIAQIDESTLYNARDVAKFANKGLPITSSMAKYFVDYLSAFRAENEDELIPANMYSKIGWAGTYAEPAFFVRPYNDKYIIDKNAVGNIAECLKTGGSFEDWKKLARDVIENPIPRFLLAAAFAVPLIKILNVGTFGIYLRAYSGAGKSAALKFAGSVYGTPAIVKNLDTTKNGLEGELAECRDLPAMYDEKQSAKLSMSDLAYLIANETGKGRMNVDSTSKVRKTWETIALMNGEENINDDIRTQGAIRRCMTIDFTKGDCLFSDVSIFERIRDSVQRNYGHAADVFITALEQENFVNLRVAFKEICDVLQLIFPKHSADYCRYIAAVTLADSLMGRYIFDAEESKALENAIANAEKIFEFIEEKQVLSDAEHEREIVEGWIAANRGEILNAPWFIEKYTDKDGREHEKVPIQRHIIGYYDDYKIYIIVKEFKAELARHGLNYSKVVTDLINIGYFVPAADGSKTQQKWFDGHNNRVIQVNYNAIDDDSEEFTE